MNLLDAARGAYVRSPGFIRHGLAPLVGLLPSNAKFGKTYHTLRQRIARAAHDPALAAAMQRQSLRELVLSAYMLSPFYRDRLSAALGSDFDFSNFAPEYLPALPIVTKHDLEAAGEAALIAPLNRLETADTSGSNGERPFRFYLDRDRSPREMAFVHDAWGRVGYRADLAKVTLRGFGLDASGRQSIRWDAALRELQLSVFPMTPEDVSAYLQEIDARGIVFLYGYPSAMELFCRHLDTLRLRPKRPFRALLPISEPVYPHQRDLFAQVLGPIPVQGFYGLSEKAAFAVERLDQPGTYDFSALYGATELVDAQGHSVTQPGQEGRIVGTGFLSTGMPFIRYDTDDLAELVEPATAENGYRLTVRNIVPRRKPNFLIAADGNRVVTIDFTPDNPRYFKGIAEYQFLQCEAGKATIRFIPTPDGTMEDAQRVAEGLTRRTHGRIVFDIEAVTQLAGGRAGKRAFIDQRIPLTSRPCPSLTEQDPGPAASPDPAPPAPREQ